MSRSRTGALIVFERKMQLDDMVRSGTVLDAAVSSELLKNIFFVKAPMHDGAVIIRHGRLLGAGLYAAPEQEREPLPGSGHAPPGGHRHERELRRGGGHRFGGDRAPSPWPSAGCSSRHLMPETLENILRNELMPQEEGEQPEKRRSPGKAPLREKGGRQ